MDNRRSPATILKPYRTVPPHVFTQEQARENLSHVFSLDDQRYRVMLQVIENSWIEQLYLAYPMEYAIVPRPLAKVNAEYQEKAIELGRLVTKGALEEAGLRPDEIDLIITVSCTGIMIPSLEAFLINELSMRRDTRRLPITEPGCARILDSMTCLFPDSHHAVPGRRQNP
jgi:predicted naringenin-chalcone synthase